MNFTSDPDHRTIQSTPVATTTPVRGHDNPSSNTNSRCRRAGKGRGGSKSHSRSRSPSGDEGEGVRRPRGRRNQKKSQSPPRDQTNEKNKSKSPARKRHNNKTSNNHHQHHSKKKNATPPDMTVVINRIDLWDCATHYIPDESNAVQPHSNPPDLTVAPYHFAPESTCESVEAVADVSNPLTSAVVAAVRVPYNLQEQHSKSCAFHKHLTGEVEMGGQGFHQIPSDVIDTSIPNPYDESICHDKYWAQRRRLFSRFDQGIKLDSEGWYSVTPEIIADHCAHRVAEMSAAMKKQHHDEGIVILDAFCGCGGNSIAFGKIPSHLISKVVCVDTDRSKLIKAAYNASIYDIPRDKLVFVECNSTFILQHCYKDGQFVLDQPAQTMPQHMPSPVVPGVYSGYQLGGLDMLPLRIDAVFMDPPWGGSDYEVLGKNGYDLAKNMKIQIGNFFEPCVESSDDGLSDDFFDTFSTSTTTSRRKKKSTMSQKARKANFNKKTEGDFINGMDLLKIAAEATSSRIVIYDLPRNTNKTSLGKAALGAGYRGNIKLEEHHLNGRLKTVTAYLGADYSSLLLNENGDVGNTGDDSMKTESV